MIYNCRVKVFPDGTKQYLFCDQAKEKDFKRALVDLPDAYLDNELDVDAERDVSDECNKRAKQRVWDIARSNDWDYFFTLTFDPACVNRFDYSACADLIKSFTQSLRYYDCEYIIVPEQHKSGAWHFHGLLRGSPPVTIAKVLKDGTVLYNFSNYRFGFTSLSKVKDSASVCTYLTKYITKELVVPPGRKRYWFSRSLNQPSFVYISSDNKKDFFFNLMAKGDFFKKIATPYGDYWMIEIHSK